MRLNVDAFEFDTKGLPRVSSLRVSLPYTGEGRVTVSVLLDSCERSAVAKWAKRMGVEVVDVKPYQSRPGDRWTHTYEAVREERDCRLRVWTSKDLDSPAEPAQAADATAVHWPAPGLRTTTMCDGEPLTREAFAVRESDVTCARCRALLAPEPVKALAGKTAALSAIVADAKDPDSVLWGVDPKAGSSCPCGCTAANGCACGLGCGCGTSRRCVVCDADGGEG